MVVIFSKQNSNYTQQNIIDILSVINHPTINFLIHSQRDYIKVVGDIHRSQFTSDNPENFYWFKIQGYMNDFVIPEFKAVHVYVCFRQMQFNYNTRQYVMGGCINPESRTDIADISGLMGFWEFKKITYGLSPKPSPTRGPRKAVKKAPSKALIRIDPKTGKVVSVANKKSPTKQKSSTKKIEIIDPKTGKPIQIGGCGCDIYYKRQDADPRRKQNGGSKGSGKNPFRKLEEHQYIIKSYSPEAEKFLGFLRSELRAIFRSIDFMKDPLAGQKLVKAHDAIIRKHLIKLNKLRVDYPENMKILNEIDQAIKNEHPDQYSRLLKAKTVRRVVYKVSKVMSPKSKKSSKNILKLLFSAKKSAKKIKSQAKGKRKLKKGNKKNKK